MLISRMTSQVQSKSREIVDVYEDADGDFKREQSVFCGIEKAQDALGV